MIRLFKFHVNFFLSRLMLVIFGLIFAFISLTYVMCIKNINSELPYSVVTSIYFTNSITQTNTAMLISSVLLFVRMLHPENICLMHFALSCGYDKKDNYFGLLLQGAIMLFVYVFFLFGNFLLIGFIFKKYFYFKMIYLSAFVYVFLNALYYGLLAFALYACFKNQFLVAGIVILALLGDVLKDDKAILSRIYLYFFPALQLDMLYLNYLHLIFLLVLFIFIDLKIYQKIVE